MRHIAAHRGRRQHDDVSGGELLTRWTVRAALALYVVTLVLRLAAPGRRELARAAWTTGCVLFLAHVAAAFHYFHGWSHGDAYRETARQTGEMVGTYWGGGLYLNYLFTLAWAADVANWWWRGTKGYAARPRWIDLLLHGFMVFMAFNAVVVFESGLVRAAGVAATVLLVSLTVYRLRSSGNAVARTA
jgi:hypothetical protein